MKISVVQAPVAPLVIKENIHWMENTLEEIIKENPDTIVLPELWNTGFAPKELSSLEEDCSEEIRSFLSSFAKKHHVNLIGGSLAQKVGDSWINRAYVYDRKGEEIATYDKAHLFSPSKENEFFTPGSSLCHFSLDDIPCALVTCYDLRFPEWIRLSAMKGTKILFCPAAWGLSRVDHLHILAQARAIENQMFVVVSNCSKAEGYRPLSGGHSVVFAPTGEAILSMDKEPQWQNTELDLSLIDQVKDFFDLWDDRRPKIYKGLDHE
ncbi:carbon-nitrogen family hydrolase [Peptoniphilus sp. KCTC 25270]|uniref:nitrilase-related carbon-nitrogen hydrolase n=1 Tax=Peptoniphilus sp. KCTC 25270 TaxID=2897414 RepID=UPI001E3EF63A|nr:nitrilase-related carbon-nitrogen hydrolase [Peptoniphilus sp. KCTC 25270]MCD1147952.1 carbon-nitrogen family hydrolase [Peptoniphilus sp. KCTC 25270]